MAKFAIASLAAGSAAYLSAVAPCLATQQQFCARHSVPYCFKDNVDDYSAQYGKRPYSWYKLLWLKETLATHEFVLWLDCDAMFIAPQCNHVDLLISGFAQTRREMLCATDDAGNMNIGVCVWRSSDRAIQMLDAMWEQVQFIEHVWWENAAFIHLMRADSAFCRQCYVLPNEASYILQGYPGYQSEKNGAVIAHFAGHLKPMIADYVPLLANCAAVIDGIKKQFGLLE